MGLLGYNMYAYCNNNPVMYCDCTGTCQHNGVAYGMGADCPSCMAGITKPEYDKIPVAQPSQTEDTNYEQYYIEKANESVLEPENSFSLAQNIINIPLNIFVTSLGLIPNTTKTKLVRNFPETFKGLGLSQQTAFYSQRRCLPVFFKLTLHLYL